MEEISKQAQPILQKISDFFDLFDLSFIVSGIASAGAILFLLEFATSLKPIMFIKSMGGFFVFLSIVLIYVFGLISWVIGKSLRKWISKSLYIEVYEKFLENQGENISLFKAYTIGLNAIQDPVQMEKEMGKRMQQLYGMMWVKLRDNQDCINSFSLLKRYWVQTATFEGLIFSAICWLVTLLILYFTLDVFYVWGTVMAALFNIIIILAFFSEATRYRRFQLSELVQTFINMNKQL